jgi:hypothetical protein
MILGYGIPLDSPTLAEKGGESTFFSPPPAFLFLFDGGERLWIFRLPFPTMFLRGSFAP